MSDHPIETACYWLAQLPPREVTPLTAPTSADVVVIGGGLTGLWAAIFLKELDPSKDVAVVEQGIAAYGASGRNAGMLAETVDHTHALAIQHFGLHEATRLAALGQTNADELVRFIADRGIDCAWEPSGRLTVALTPAHMDEARHTVEVAETLGLTTFHLRDEAQVRAEVHCPLYLGGVAIDGGGILDPARLTDGLRAEAQRLGVRVYERSPVTAVEHDAAGVTVRANGTTLRAARAIFGMSAYTHTLLPSVAHRFIPLYDYILVSEPLTPEQWARIGWSQRQGITDGRTFFNYYRPTADGRVLWGTSEAAYYPPNRVDAACDHSPAHYDSLEASWKRHFPDVAELRWQYRWGGAICSTTRMTPFIGRALGGKAAYGLGFTGHGLGTTRIVGRVLAHLTLEKPSELLDLALVTKPPFPYPPEPIRGWAVDAVTASLRKVDAGQSPNLLLRALDLLGLGFSS